VTSHDVRRPRRLAETLCCPYSPTRATPPAGRMGFVYATQAAAWRRVLIVVPWTAPRGMLKRGTVVGFRLLVGIRG
jgi:hypothetical protein